MIIRRTAIISLFLFLFVLANAQSISDYYHTAANYYVQGEKKNAKKTIEDAISKYPNDKKLKQLAEKVNKLPDENKDKQNKDQNKDQQDKNKDQQKEQPQPQQPQMSKQNAQQILDALMQDEQNAQDKAKKQQVRGTKKADKDW